MHAVRILQPRVVHLFHVRAGAAIQEGLGCRPAVVLARGLGKNHLAGPGQRMTADHPGCVSFGPAYAWRQGSQRPDYCPCLIHFHLKHGIEGYFGALSYSISIRNDTIINTKEMQIS